MTVSQLIEILKTQPPYLTVKIADWNECWADPAILEPQEVFIRGEPGDQYLLLGEDYKG
jgi:hypothetical protein